jgi:hypothetical protein
MAAAPAAATLPLPRSVGCSSVGRVIPAAHTHLLSFLVHCGFNGGGIQCTDMERDVDLILTALRVLSAVVVQQRPDPSDLNFLRGVMPEMANAPADDLACEIIQKAAKRRAELRNKSVAA